MKIGILTQPLRNNYGGILQAYALQTTLKRRGHDPWIINREYPEPSRLRKALSNFKWVIFSLIFNKSNRSKEREIITQHTSQFIKSYINPITQKLTKSKHLRKLGKQGFDAFIIGSDQVWRPSYSPCITNYFLDFTENWENVKRLAYAASFGVDDWEFTQEQTIKCSKLIQMFDAVSVREDSGIDLCKKYFGVEAVHLLDPTMLLDAEDYKKIIEAENEPLSQGNLMVYILDETTEKKEIVQTIASKLNLFSFYLMPELNLPRSANSPIEKYIFPSVTSWLKGFIDANFVVTDSFHGTIFSIIFNKPFIAIGNEDRGLARFSSLLKMFNLEHRLIINRSNLNKELIHEKINWEQINQSLEKKRKQTDLFFKQNGL